VVRRKDYELLLKLYYFETPTLYNFAAVSEFLHQAQRRLDKYPPLFWVKSRRLNLTACALVAFHNGMHLQPNGQTLSAMSLTISRHGMVFPLFLVSYANYLGILS